MRGLYPGGEGAGYAGGILSAGVDGIRIAEVRVTMETSKPGNGWSGANCVIVREGDDSDICITSWLAGKTDGEACKRGAAAP